METSKLILNGTEYYFTDDNTQANGIHKVMLNGDTYNIREYQSGWQPGANTIAYYPLDTTNTVNDLSSNHFNGTNSGVTFGEYGGVDCGYFTGSNSYISIANQSEFMSNNLTINVWVNTSIANGNGGILYKGPFNGSIGVYQLFQLSTGFRFRGQTEAGDCVYSSPSTNTWYNVVVTYDWNTAKVYVNGTLADSKQWSYTKPTNTNGLYIGAYYAGQYGFKGYISKMILEDKVRTADEISAYFDQTKSLYGIS